MRKRYILIDNNLIENLNNENDKSMLNNFLNTYHDKFNIKILSNIELNSYEPKKPIESDEFRRYTVDSVTGYNNVFTGICNMVNNNKISFGFTLDNNSNILQNTYMVISNSKFVLNNIASEYKLYYNSNNNMLDFQNENVYYINNFDDVSQIVEFDHKFF